MDEQFEFRATVAKVDEALGLVMGWGIVCTEAGEPYYDTQGDHIPDESMLAVATDFMKSARMAGEQHQRMDAGTVLFAWPMTAEIAKQFGIECKKTGLMIAMKPDAGMLAKFKSGELTGFSIGGGRIYDEVVE